jgi:L,D-transpeptidase catalytic domain
MVGPCLSSESVMRWLGLFALALIVGLTTSASAEVLAVIDKSSQSMSVSINGANIYNWTVSTGSPGRDTPNGRLTAQRLERVYYSKKYDDAPMPNSVFFYEGYAIHGTYQESKLGSPVSHGCVRLARHNAITLYELVSAQGIRNTRVVVIGETPERREPMVRDDRGPERYDTGRYDPYSVERTFAARSRGTYYDDRPRSRGFQEFDDGYDAPRYVEPRRRVYRYDDWRRY